MKAYGFKEVHTVDIYATQNFPLLYKSTINKSNTNTGQIQIVTNNTLWYARNQQQQNLRNLIQNYTLQELPHEVLLQFKIYGKGQVVNSDHLLGNWN